MHVVREKYPQHSPSKHSKAHTDRPPSIIHSQAQSRMEQAGDNVGTAPATVGRAFDAAIKPE